MSKLNDMKIALKQLEELGLPISSEQKRTLRQAENNYVLNEIIPKIKESLRGMFDEIEHKVKIIIDFDGDPTHEPNVYKEVAPVVVKAPDLFNNKDKSRNTGLRVTFPDGKRIQGKGVDVIMTIVKEVGPDLVHEMDIRCCGLPLVDDHRNDGPYADNQKPLPDGYWIITNSNTVTKKEQIDTISDTLDLGLKVEVLNKAGEVVDTDATRKRAQQLNIRVTTPDGQLFYNDVQWKTLRAVVLYAGADRVEELGLKSVGIPLIDDHITPGIYAKQQHEIAHNVFLNTYSDTRGKARQIQEISDRLDLGLKVELI